MRAAISRHLPSLLFVTFLVGFFVFFSSDVAAQFGIDRDIVPPDIIAATGGEGSLIGLVKTIINYALGFLATLVLALVIYGGFMYVTAGVSEAGAETGKKILTYSALGVVIILLSYVFVNTLLNAGQQGPPP